MGSPVCLQYICVGMSIPLVHYIRSVQGSLNLLFERCSNGDNAAMKYMILRSQQWKQSLFVAVQQLHLSKMWYSRG